MADEAKVKTPKGLVWDLVNGIGFYNVGLCHAKMAYDSDYFKKYVGYAATKMGEELDGFRVGLVNRYVPNEHVIDVGVGCGNFVEKRGEGTFGYDINPAAVEWLAKNGLWWDPWQFQMPHATFWDSLEHFADPGAILARVREFAFVSIPIFRDAVHAEQSKHFRPDEHYWYFTRPGLLEFMRNRGFDRLEETDRETRLGREDIMTFVFKRRRG